MGNQQSAPKQQQYHNQTEYEQHKKEAALQKKCESLIEECAKLSIALEESKKIVHQSYKKKLDDMGSRNNALIDENNQLHVENQRFKQKLKSSETAISVHEKEIQTKEEMIEKHKKEYQLCSEQYDKQVQKHIEYVERMQKHNQQLKITLAATRNALKDEKEKHLMVRHDLRKLTQTFHKNVRHKIRSYIIRNLRVINSTDFRKKCLTEIMDDTWIPNVIEREYLKDMYAKIMTYVRIELVDDE